jgi:tRNA1(Val) A37 N6-methylase TrmN6
MPPEIDRSIDRISREASLRLDPSRRSEFGQFMTPAVIAEFMASLFSDFSGPVRLLDPGAGVGALSLAFASRYLSQAHEGGSLEVEAYEIEPILLDYLAHELQTVTARAASQGSQFRYVVHEKDFIADATFAIGFGEPRFTHVILNPPYKKMGSNSDHRKQLRSLGIDTVNLYTAFLGLAVAHVRDGGEIVAIVPRSFCNGAYFRPFRQWLLKRVALRHIHVFASRKKAFEEDDVLQENVIIHLQRGGDQPAVIVSTSQDAGFSDYNEQEIAYSEIVEIEDPQFFIRVPTLKVNGESELFSHTLGDLGLTVSTGPVVDFRVRDFWLSEPQSECAPMLYAHHFKGGSLTWPKKHKKPNAVRLNDETRKWLMPRGCYTITKRFSAKEERRRLVAYVVDPQHLPYELYGFENHLNVFHAAKSGMDPDIAQGLALFLNSTLADNSFRNFSGHTQVNATDLRSMRYPSKRLLKKFGIWAQSRLLLSQEMVDAYIESQHGE